MKTTDAIRLRPTADCAKEISRFPAISALRQWIHVDCAEIADGAGSGEFSRARTTEALFGLHVELHRYAV